MASKSMMFLAGLALAMASAAPVLANEAQGMPTKAYLMETATTSLPSGGLLAGGELKNIQARTKSTAPVFVRVERIQDVIGATETDPTCGRYRVAYTQAGVKDASGKVSPEPISFGFDINICGDGRPAIARD